MQTDPRFARVLAAGVLLAGGLGLIVLGGCFLIGVMILLTGTGFGTQPLMLTWTVSLYALLMVLCLMAIACIGGGAFLITLSARSLLLTMKR